MKKTYIYIILIVSLTVIFSGCGYKISGSGKYLPEELKTVAIPDFENKTTRAEAEQYVTYAVRDEFIKRSALKLVDKTSDADALLNGEIIRFAVKPLSDSYIGSVNQYIVNITLNVTLINLGNNKIIYEKKNLSFMENYNIEDGDFFSQETEALQKIAEKFASSIVSQILENF